MPDITYPAAAGPLPGYLAVPDGGGPWPGVVVVHDVLGMTADLRRITDRFAAGSCLALAPALYQRGPKIRCIVAVLSTVRAHFAGSGAAYDDLVAARDHLIADPRCTGKVGLAGFCMGAGFCLQMAPRSMFDATGPNYGSLPKTITALHRSCPVVASYGTKDPIVRHGAAARLEAVLAEGNVPRDVKEYSDVGHSFMNNPGASGAVRVVARVVRLGYSEREAEDAWRRILVFFSDHLT